MFITITIIIIKINEKGTGDPSEWPGPQLYHTCHNLPPSEIDGGGCFWMFLQAQ